MNTIVALSRYGFKLDSLRNDWEKVDKSLLHRDLFNSLEKGLKIEVKERNDKGFIIDFSLADKVEGVSDTDKGKLLNPQQSKDSFNSMPLSASVLATDKQREILKGQCLNIAFNKSEFIPTMQRIENAKSLFKALEDADYYNW